MREPTIHAQLASTVVPILRQRSDHQLVYDVYTSEVISVSQRHDTEANLYFTVELPTGWSGEIFNRSHRLAVIHHNNPVLVTFPARVFGRFFFAKGMLIGQMICRPP